MTYLGLENLSSKNIEKLIENKITTIIDLRTLEEVQRKPGVFLKNNYFEYYNVTIAGGGRIPDEPTEVVESYIEMLNGKEAIRNIFNIIANSKGGTIYYCNAGKDRTGVITALILKLLDIDNEEIAKDYVLSGEYLKEMLFNFSLHSEKENILEIITPKKENMHIFLERLEKEYGGVENYLENIGVTKTEINAIKALLK